MGFNCLESLWRGSLRIGVHWKIQFLWGQGERGHKKVIQWGDCLKRDVWIVFRFKILGLGRKREWCFFFEGGERRHCTLCPNTEMLMEKPANCSKKEGVKTILQNDCEWLTFGWCIAHCLQLALKDRFCKTAFSEVDELILQFSICIICTKNFIKNFNSLEND